MGSEEVGERHKVNGRISKKIRKEAEINVYKTYVGFVKAVMSLPLRKRLKFCASILLKYKYS